MESPAYQYLNRWINNWNAYALQTKTGAYKAIRNSRITNELLEKHFLGEETIGVYGIDPVTQTSKWLCWDVDTEAEEQLSNLIDWLAYFGITSLRESRRQGRSGHLWSVFEQPIATSDAFRILKHGQFLWKVPGEVFPAQPKLKPGQVGSLCRLPLGRHQKPSAGGIWGLFSACPDEAVDKQLFWFLEHRTNSISDINRLLETVPKTRELPERKRNKQQFKGRLIEVFPPDWEWKGCEPELAGPCPVCRENGWDSKGYNLSINTEENILFCHRNQGEHTFQQILKAARLAKVTV